MQGSLMLRPDAVMKHRGTSCLHHKQFAVPSLTCSSFRKRTFWIRIWPFDKTFLSAFQSTATCSRAVASGSSAIVDPMTVGLGDQSGCPCGGSGSIRLEEEVSFILKDTPVDPGRSRTTWSLMSCMCTKQLLCFAKSIASIRTSSSTCWMCVSCGLEIHMS